MTVESTAFYTDWYLANGTNKTWNYDFAILAESNITILVRDGTDDSTSVKYTNGFSFNPNSDYSAGTITFPATGDALAAGKQLRIVRSMDFLQTTEIGMEGNFSPILHEWAFDKLTMQTQELKEGAERAIKVPLGFSGYELSSTFADYTTFMKLGDLIVPGPTAAQIQQAETSAEEAIAAKDAAETARDIAAGYAASINSVNFYTKIQIDDFRTADQTSAKNAGNLNAGIIPDARLPSRLKTGSSLYIASQADAEAGVENTKAMTALRTKQAIAAIVPSNPVKAWVNFNGTGQVAIRDSLNVSSIGDNGTCDYTVNFAVALSSANYAVVCGIGDVSNGNIGMKILTSGGYTGPPLLKTTSAVRVGGYNGYDILTASVVIFG